MNKAKLIRDLIEDVIWADDDVEDFLKLLLRPEIFDRVEFVEEHPIIGHYDFVLITAIEKSGVPFSFIGADQGTALTVQGAIRFLTANSATHPILIKLKCDYYPLFQYLMDKKKEQEINAILEPIMQKFRMDRLMAEIDQALEDRDKERFMELSKELNELKGAKVYAAN